LRLGVRGKLFFFSLILIAATGLISGVFLERSLRSWLEARIDSELVHVAKAARELVMSAPSLALPVVDDLADRSGRASGARITIVDGGGRVLGDSQLTSVKLARVENHGARPEIVAALNTGEGRARRYSTTLRTDMRYLAVRYSRGDRAGTVRAAMPLSEVDVAIRRMRLLILAAGLLGLVAALILSATASHWISGALRSLVGRAKALASGDRQGRIEHASRDELGGIAGSVNRLADELEETLSALADERGRLSAILESMSDAVVVIDGDRRITLANDAAAGLLGLNRSPVGRPLVEVVRSPRLIALVSGGAADEAELTIPGSPEREVIARAAPIKNSDGQVIVMLDVTEIRRLERVRQDFVANVSHELRTPISIIRANAETLASGAMEEPEQAGRFVEALQRQAERMGSLIGDLLDLARIESGDVGGEVEDVEVAAVLARAREELIGKAKAKGIELEISAEEGVTVRADRQALDQVLLNLVDNAIKYAPEQGRVILRSKMVESVARLEVEDNGPGIGLEHADRIFERFYRIDPGRSRELGGTGLGLAIVKHLVAQMAGEIGVEPNKPLGSVFWVTLPSGGEVA